MKQTAQSTTSPTPRKEADRGQLALYEMIIEDLLAQIRANDFSYDMPICTEKQLSEKYNVSRITAKRALTELEYRGVLYRKRGVGSFVVSGVDLSSPAAPPSRQEASPKNFALQLPFNVTVGGIFDTVQVISDYLNEDGYSLGIYITKKNAATEKASLKRLIEQPLSGLIYYPITNQIHLDLLNEFVLSRKPVIVIDKSTDCPYIHNIISDNFDGGRLITEHLFSLGHRNIVFLCNASMEKTASIRDRFGGFLSVMREHGINLTPNMLVELNGEISIENEPSATVNEVLSRLVKNGITAIETENDEVANVLLKSCHNQGIRVPEDISICGFDDNMWARNAVPGITTIAQDFRGIGEAVTELLRDLRKSPNLPARKIVLPVRLVVRESTGAPVQR